MLGGWRKVVFGRAKPKMSAREKARTNFRRPPEHVPIFEGFVTVLMF